MYSAYYMRDATNEICAIIIDVEENRVPPDGVRSDHGGRLEPELILEKGLCR